MENERRKQLAYINLILRTRGWKIAELARRAGISASTFSKFRNDANNAAQMEPSTVMLLEEASGIPYGADVKGEQLDEPEGALYQAGGSDLSEMVKMMRAGRNGVDPWVLKTRSLETAGYMPGDVVLVDLNTPAKSGDVVCAQIYHRGVAETVFRIYEEPFLVAATFDPAKFKPLLVDNSRVVIRGVVTASLRDRRAA